MTTPSSTSLDKKKCPFCAEEIRAEAIKCKHCGEMLHKKGKQPEVEKKESQEQIRCPVCGSTQVSAQKKGFGWGKALIGGVLTGGIGLIAGFHGSRDLLVTCLSCGHRFEPVKKSKQRVLKNLVECTCGSELFAPTSEIEKSDLQCKRCGNVYAYPQWDAEVSSGKKGTMIVRLTLLGSQPEELTLLRDGNVK